MTAPTLFFFLAPVLSAPQQLPADCPHPTRVLATSDLHRAAEGEDWMPEEPRAWRVLAPRWLEAGAQRLLGAADAAELEAFALSRNQWQPAELAAWRRAATPPRVELVYRLSRAADGAVLLGGTQPVEMGVAVALSDLRSRAVVRELDVEIAQGAAIADPEAGTQFAGSSLAVELLPVPGHGYRAEFAVVGTAFGDFEEAETGYEAIPVFDRLNQTLAEAGWRSLLVPGRASVFRLPGPGGDELQLVVECRGPVPPELLEAPPELAVCAAPTLAEDAAGWAAVVAELERAGDTWFSASGWLALADEFGRADQQAILRRAVEAGSRAWEVELALAFRGLDAPLPPLALAGELLGDEELRFSRGASTLALTDWDVEVAQQSRIADPRFRTLFEGAEGSLLVEADGALRLDLQLSRVTAGEPLRLGLSRAIPLGAMEGVGRELGADRVVVERPELASLAIRGRFVPDADGVVHVVREAAGLLGPGGRVELSLRVRSID